MQATKTNQKTNDVRTAVISAFLLAWSLGFFALYLFFYHFWWLFILFGTLLVGCSYLIPKPAHQEELSAYSTFTRLFDPNARRLQLIAVALVVLGLCFKAISFVVAHTTLRGLLLTALFVAIPMIFYFFRQQMKRNPYQAVRPGEFALAMIVVIGGMFLIASPLKWSDVIGYLSGTTAGSPPSASQQYQQPAQQQITPQPTPQPRAENAAERRASIEAQQRQECAAESQCRSEHTEERVALRITNKGYEDVKIYWINYDGHRVFYRGLAPEESYVQATYVGHPWVITDQFDRCQKLFVAARDLDDVVASGGH